MRGGGLEPALGDKGIGDQGGPIEGVNFPKLDLMTKEQWRGTCTFDKEAIQQNKCVSLPLVPLLVVNYKKILKHIPQLEDLVVGPRNNYLLEQFNIEQ